MTRLSKTARSARALAGGLVAAIVAGGMALVINLGILRASGPPEGPGALGDRMVVAAAPSGSSHVRPEAPVHGRGVTLQPGVPTARSGSGQARVSGGSRGISQAGGPEGEHRYGARNDD